MKIKRSDKQYTDVETFEEYEFSSCIAYEMMIRHPKIIEITRYKLEPLEDREQRSKPFTNNDEDWFLYGLPGELHLKYHFFDDLIDNDIYDIYDIYDYSSNSISHKKEDEGLKETYIEYEGFARSTASYPDESTIPFYAKNVITRHFKRPEVAVYEIENDVNVRLDFSKPEGELIAYIKHLKNAYNKDIIHPPYDEFVNKIPKTGTKKSLPKGSVMADIFYVYDALILGYTKRKIQNEVYNYYADKGIETRTLDYKTIKKYHEFAIDYIDNKKYLEIATGKRLDKLKLGTLMK